MENLFIFALLFWWDKWVLISEVYLFLGHKALQSDIWDIFKGSSYRDILEGHGRLKESAPLSSLPSHQREVDFHDLACSWEHGLYVLLSLVIEPTNLKRFLLSRKNGQPEAVGDEQMAPARIPCVGVPPVTKHREPEEQWAALARLTNMSHALIQLQGRAGQWLCLLSMSSVSVSGLGS